MPIYLSLLLNFQGDSKYCYADVCIFVGVDEKLGLGTEQGGFVQDVAGALHQPALRVNKSIQATLTRLMQKHAETDCSFKPQIISTLPNLVCYPTHRSTTANRDASKSRRYLKAGMYKL